MEEITELYKDLASKYGFELWNNNNMNDGYAIHRDDVPFDINFLFYEHRLIFETNFNYDFSDFEEDCPLERIIGDLQKMNECNKYVLEKNGAYNGDYLIKDNHANFFHTVGADADRKCVIRLEEFIKTIDEYFKLGE